MPRPTFFNLPDDKRLRLVELAIDEFSANPYPAASLTRIGARAGISKGSLYQYFDDKLDLYRWLVLDELPRRKLAALQVDLPPAEQGLFPHLEVLCTAGLRWAAAQPRLWRLGARVQELSDDPDLGALHDALQRMGDSWMRELLGAAAARGELRKGLNLDAVVPMVNALLGIGLAQAALAELGLSLATLSTQPERLSALSPAQAHRLAAEAVDLVRRAIGRGGAR